MSAIFYFMNGQYLNHFNIIKTYERTFKNGDKRGYWDIGRNGRDGRMSFYIDKKMGYISNRYQNKENEDNTNDTNDTNIIDSYFVDTFGIYGEYAKKVVVDEEKDYLFTTRFIRNEIEKNGDLIDTEEIYDDSYFYGRFLVRSNKNNENNENNESNESNKNCLYTIYFTLDILSEKMCILVTDINKMSILFILHLCYLCHILYSSTKNSTNDITFMIKFPENATMDIFLNNRFEHTEEKFDMISKFFMDEYIRYKTAKMTLPCDEILSHLIKILEDK